MENKLLDLSSIHIPRWDELPSIDLYMDQVVLFINGNLGQIYIDFNSCLLTKSMVNNYVKAKIVDAPINKKYSRLAIGMIIVVYLLKNCYTMDEIKKIIHLGISLDDTKTTYNRFCEAIEDAITNAFNGEIHLKNEAIAGRENKYLMDNFALSFACKIYVHSVFLK